jgi:hypothetical protein
MLRPFPLFGMRHAVFDELAKIIIRNENRYLHLEL